MRKYEFIIAMRYLFSRERRTLASVITMIATGGVAIGVAALIAVLGVMDGATDLLFSRVAQLFPHVRIQPESAEMDPNPDARMLKMLNGDPRVEIALPILNKYGIIQPARGLESDKEPVTIFGLDADTARLFGFDKKGTSSLARNEIMIGEPLALKLKLKPGDMIQILAVDPHARNASSQQVKVARLSVVGIFSMGFNDFDLQTVYMNKERLREIYGAAATFDFIHVKLKDPLQSQAFNESLQLPITYRSWDWSDPHFSDTGSFFAMLTFQKYLLFALLLLIIIVAAFNIIGTLILMVNDKTREIGILRAIGAGQHALARVFLIDGMLVGILGTFVGVILGLVICALIPYVQISMPASIYNFETLPVKVHWGSVGLVVAAALFICTIASLLPARHAAKLKPVEALRYD